VVLLPSGAMTGAPGFPSSPGASKNCQPRDRVGEGQVVLLPPGSMTGAPGTDQEVHPRALCAPPPLVRSRRGGGGAHAIAERDVDRLRSILRLYVGTHDFRAFGGELEGAVAGRWRVGVAMTMSGCWRWRATVKGGGRTQQSTLGERWEGGA
jgi:hypothetical protein